MELMFPQLALPIADLVHREQLECKLFQKVSVCFGALIATSASRVDCSKRYRRCLLLPGANPKN